MSNKIINNEIVSTSKSSFDGTDLFAHLPADDPFNVKKDRLASELAALMSYCRKSRTSIADELGWKKSQVTRLLSGNQNPTLKTLWDFSSHLGYDFDIVFRSFQEQEENRQPWHKSSVVDFIAPNVENVFKFIHQVKVQTPIEVVKDCFEGRASAVYISITPQRNTPLTIGNKVDILDLDVPVTVAASQNFSVFLDKEKV